jgi:hypothetical protein
MRNLSRRLLVAASFAVLATTWPGGADAAPSKLVHMRPIRDALGTGAPQRPAKMLSDADALKAIPPGSVCSCDVPEGFTWNPGVVTVAIAKTASLPPDVAGGPNVKGGVVAPSMSAVAATRNYIAFVNNLHLNVRLAEVQDLDAANILLVVTPTQLGAFVQAVTYGTGVRVAVAFVPQIGAANFPAVDDFRRVVFPHELDHAMGLVIHVLVQCFPQPSGAKTIQFPEDRYNIDAQVTYGEHPGALDVRGLRLAYPRTIQAWFIESWVASAEG